MPRVLLVDDDTRLGESLQAYFAGEKYTVEFLTNGEDALQLLRFYDFDVLILDWALPGISGEIVCQEYRKRGGVAPIIFLTGKNDITFLERGLHVGADDYLKKPFNMRELTARLRSLLRRKHHAVPEEFRVGDLVFQPGVHNIKCGELELQLTPTETDLLAVFFRNPGKAFTAQELLEAVWTGEGTATTNTVRTWISLTRSKLKQIGLQDLIRTVPGEGYVLDSR